MGSVLSDSLFSDHRRIEELLRVRVGSLAKPDAARLAEDRFIRHHIRVARHLFQLFRDPVLSEAALLHGLSERALARSDPPVAVEVREVVHAWAGLRRRVSPGTSKENLRQILARLGEPRAAPLLVEERRDSVDPSGALFEWSRLFNTKAAPIPEAARTLDTTHGPLRTREPHNGREYEEDQQIAYLKEVVVPTAEHCALWLSRNVLADIAAIAADFGRAQAMVAWCIEQQDERTACRQRVTAIQDVLGDGFRCRWEWHRLGDLLEQQPVVPAAARRDDALAVTGMVTVTCRDPVDCYRALGRLRCAPGVCYDTDHLRDTIGGSPREGLPALTGRVVLTVDQRSFPVTVRIEPPRGDVTPWRSVLTERLSAPKPNTSEEIRVLTPAGDYRDLPKGARVLNFAVEVHRSFVGWTKAAYVNGNGPFGLLHPLVNGDCVELVRSDRFQLPPEGWNQQIPRPGSVRSMLQRNFLPLVTETARAELRDRIQVPADGDDSERLFDTLLARAHEAVEMTGEGPRGKNIDWWQRQYGLYAMERKGVPLLLERKVDNATLERFCLALEDEAKSLAGHVAEIEIDPELRMRRARLVYCPECSPPHSASLVVTVESHALVLHDDRFDCGDGGRPVVRRRNSNRHHYFCIEARDRPDILVDVLLVFRRKGARVVGVVAERVGRGWAVIRVETGLMLRAPERDLVKTIKLLPDVSRVVGPGEAPIPMLENALPPRKWRHDVGNVPSPFVCGSIVKDPRQFYGREREMDQLRAAARAVEGHAQTGGLCLINGPLKIGKTSLAMNLQRELEQRDPAGTLWCYLRMSVEDRWLSCEAKIYERLRDRVDAHREQWPTDLTADVGSPEEPPGEALRRLVRACGRAKPSLVLIVVIDEFQRALASASHDSEQEHAFLGFLDFLLNTPHVLGVLVGPAASIGEMSPRIQQALRSAEEIRLGQLSRQESAALLKAEQMIGGPSIRLAKGAAPRAYKEVEGNPYWLNRLGKAMLDQAHRRGMNTKLVFDKTMLEEATDMLSIDDRLFVDQVEPVESGRSDPRPFRPLAQLLAKRLLEHGQAAAPAPAPALVEQLRSHGFGNFNADLVVRTLKTMRVMGGVIRTAEGYRMSSRLLARWVASRPRNDHDEIP